MQSNYLCLASSSGDLQEVNNIINSAFVYVDVKGYKGFTALQLACMNGHLETVLTLLNHGACVNLKCGQFERTPLHYACIANNEQIVEKLLDFGAITDLFDVHGYTPLQLTRSTEVCDLLYKGEKSLCLAVQLGDINLAKEILIDSTLEKNFSITPELLQKKISAGKYGRKTSKKMIFKNLGLCALVDQTNERGLGPLHLAALQENLEMLQLLLSYGAKIDLPGGLEKQSPLFFACFAGHAHCARFLLMVGADKEFCDSRGMQAIDYVENRMKSLDSKITNETSMATTANDGFDSFISPQYRPYMNVCHSLTDSPSELRLQYQRLRVILNVLHCGQQKLHTALKDTNIDELRRLLAEEEVDVNGHLSKNLPITALHYAASLGLESAINILLSYNANPYIHDDQTYTPVHIASQNGYLGVIKELLNHGVDINIQTGIQRYTCLHIATIRNRKSVVQFLVEKGADRTLTDMSGKTAFTLASNDVMRSLLASGDEQLYVAVKSNQYEAVKIFLEVIDVNTNFHDHLTPLHIACEIGAYDVCKMLIDHGARINVLGGATYCTPLHNACQSSSTEIVKLLLRHGADLTLSDQNGKTAYEVAANNDIRRTLITYNKKKSKESNPVVTQSNPVHQEDSCRICFSNDVTVMVLPCQHASFCSDCVVKIQECALCRAPINGIVQLSESIS